jgi:hypothetical protein
MKNKYYEQFMTYISRKQHIHVMPIVKLMLWRHIDYYKHCHTSFFLLLDVGLSVVPHYFFKLIRRSLKNNDILSKHLPNASYKLNTLSLCQFYRMRIIIYINCL